MNILNFSVALVFFLQSNFAFASCTQSSDALGDQEEIRAVNSQLFELTFSDNVSGLKELLGNPKNTAKITSKGIAAALNSAMWDESTGSLKVLLEHPCCELCDIKKTYSIADQFFWGQTETKSLIKAKIIGLGGKDPDEPSDDDNSTC